jgi:hypothetical protein
MKLTKKLDCDDIRDFLLLSESTVLGSDPSDDEVAEQIRRCPPHFSNIAYTNAQSNTGICTATAPAVTGVTWNLTSLQISQAGPTTGPNAKLVIYDGSVATGTVLYAVYLGAPSTGGTGQAGVGSVGIIQDIPLPKSPQGLAGIQASPGNAMNIQVVGTGANQVSINARFSDGLP